MSPVPAEPPGREADKRLLVVSLHAPPSGGVGGLRWWGLSRHLARRGWRVRLVTANPRAESVSRPDGMCVEGVPPRATLGGRYHRWSARKARAGKGREPSLPRSEVTGESEGASIGAIRALRREVGGLLVFPDDGRGWLLRAVAAVRRSVRDFRPAIAVSTGPPHSVHLALRAALGGGKLWLADFRDPWADEARAHLDIAWAVPLQAWMEGFVIRSASRVLTTTPELASVYRERFPGAWVTCLPNGTDVEELPRWEPDRADGLSVVHLGTLYHRRNPLPAVRAFALFLRRSPEGAKAGSTLRFVGHLEEEFRRKIQESARQEGIENRVEMTGVRPRDEALRILARSGLALVLAQDQETAVPAKIYESVGMGVPTLVITEPESATGAAARRLGAAVHGPSSLEAIAASMEAAWSGDWTVDRSSSAQVDYAELAGVAEQLLLETLRGQG